VFRRWSLAALLVSSLVLTSCALPSSHVRSASAKRSHTALSTLAFLTLEQHFLTKSFTATYTAVGWQDFHFNGTVLVAHSPNPKYSSADFPMDPHYGEVTYMTSNAKTGSIQWIQINGRDTGCITNPRNSAHWHCSGPVPDAQSNGFQLAFAPYEPFQAMEDVNAWTSYGRVRAAISIVHSNRFGALYCLSVGQGPQHSKVCIEPTGLLVSENFHWKSESSSTTLESFNLHVSRSTFQQLAPSAGPFELPLKSS